MPTITNHGVRIHYEVEGQGSPLLLLHGLTYTLEGWRTFGYVSPLKDSYQLVLVDLRGSGASDVFHDPADYAMEAVVADCLGVLDALKIDRAHVWGYSLGAEIAFRIAQAAPERVLSLITGGGHPFERDGNPPAFVVEGLAAGFERWLADWKAVLGDVPAEHVAQLQRGDPQAFVAWVRTQWPGADSALSGLDVPVLAYAGDLDGYALPLTRRYAGLLPQATLVELPGLDHFTAFTRSDMVLPHVNQFLSAVAPS